MNLPASFDADLSQSCKEAIPIRIVFENRFTAIATIHHMINRPRILHSQLAGHADDLPNRATFVNSNIYNSRD